MSIQVVPVPLPGREQVAIVAALRGGPRFEGRDESGLTHFLEHMFFRGTRRLDHRALMAAFDDAGSEPQAHTGDDELVLSVVVTREKVAAGARLLSSVLLEPAFREIERERQLILEERLDLVNEDGEACDLDDVARRLAFPGQALGRSVLGEERDIRRVARRHLERHRRRLVRDGNLVVAIAGPVGPADVRAVSAAFARVPRGEALEPAPATPETGFSFVRVEGSPRCDLRIQLAGPGEEARARLELLAGVLDGGPTSRLPLRLVDEGFAYDARGGVSGFPDFSLLEVDLSVSTERLLAALGRAFAVLRDLRRGIEPREVERARERALRHRRFGRDDVLGEAEWHAREALLGRFPDRRRQIAALRRTSVAHVRELAREVIRPERLGLALIGNPSRRVLREARALAARARLS